MDSMHDMLKQENVQIIDHVCDWEDAVRVAVQPLVETGYVHASYIDAIIESAKEVGPYFVVCPDLALLHARPEQGVIKRQLAVSVLRKPVRFKPEGPDVRLLVTLAAEDANSHLKVIQTLVELLGDPAKIQEIVQAQTAQQVYELFVNSPAG